MLDAGCSSSIERDPALREPNQVSRNKTLAPGEY